MIPIALLFALLLPIPQQGDTPPTSTDSTQQQVERANAARERVRQTGIRVNELAANIHTEADARAFVDAVAEQVGMRFSGDWITATMRERVAHAEFQGVKDPAHLVPEQRIVNVWNEYVREINAPGESLITAAELHNLRDGMLVGDRQMWERQFQQVWTAPAIHAVNADGSLADGCRAVEALKILNELFREPAILEGARRRVKEGVLVSDQVKRLQQSKPRDSAPVRSRGTLQLRAPSNAVRLAEVQYLQDHGQLDYYRMMMRLFEELFPRE